MVKNARSLLFRIIIISAKNQVKVQQKVLTKNIVKGKLPLYIYRKKNSKQKSQSNHHQFLRPHQPQFWWNALLATFLACGGGFCSGMTVGLNSLDKLGLQIQQITGNAQQKKVASRILHTIKDHHLFLVTLLIGNAMVLEWLPLVIHKLMPDWAAILFSTIVVVIVAQIVPMSATTGPEKVKLAYLGTPLVDLMIKLYYFIAYPIARGLDKLLGVVDTSKIKRRDFLAVINQKKYNQLKPLEMIMMNEFFVGPKFTSVQQVMTPLNQLFILSMENEITQQLISRISESESEYILVAQQHQKEQNFNIISVIKMKQFVCSYLKLRPSDNRGYLKLKDIVKPQFPIQSNDKNTAKKKQLHTLDDINNYNTKHKLPVIYSDTGLLDTLGILDMKHCRVALVHKQRRRKQDTNIAYLDADDHIVYYDPFSEEDKKSIIGVINLNQIMDAVIDVHEKDSQIFSAIVEPSPKKRKLIKRASIMSAYSYQSN